jgi:hypothetical protein
MQHALLSVGNWCFSQESLDNEQAGIWWLIQTEEVPRAAAGGQYGQYVTLFRNLKGQFIKSF